MAVLNQNCIAGSRLVIGIVLLGLAVFASGCTTQTKRLDIGAGGISGRPVAVLNNPVKPMRRGIYSKGSLVDDILKAATGTYKKVSQVAHPSINPTQIVEDKLIADLARYYRATAATRLNLPMKSFNHNRRWPDKGRISTIASSAKLQGFDGLVLDVIPEMYESVIYGHGLAMFGELLDRERVVLFYSAKVAVIDAASGEVLASGFCENQDGGYPPSLDAVIAGGQQFVDKWVRKRADKCAADMIDKILRKG